MPWDDRWRAGAFTPRSKRKTDHATRQEIADRYRAGATIAAVARAMGLAYGTVRQALIDSGVELRPRGTRGIDG